MEEAAVKDDFLLMAPNHLCSATEFQALPVKVQRTPKAKHMTILVADRFIKPVSRGGQRVHIVPARLFTRMVADIQVITETVQHKATQTPATWGPDGPTLRRTVTVPIRYRQETSRMPAQTNNQSPKDKEIVQRRKKPPRKNTTRRKRL